jgi:ribosome-interacting GTPase 1
MRLLRVYTRKRGEHPDLNDPVIVRRGGTIEDVVRLACSSHIGPAR